MNIATLRLRYTQFFIICLLGVSLYAMSQSLPGGISQFQDNLWNRKPLITAFTNLKIAMGNRVINQVVLSKNGFLHIPAQLNSYQKTAPTSQTAIIETQQKLQKLYDELHKENITLLFVIAPNKTTIYQDKLPDEIQIFNKRSKLDEFRDYIDKNGPPVFLDLRPALLAGRKQQEIYEKTDTHWNTYGAFIAYTEIMKALSKTYPALKPKSIDDFKVSTSQPYLHDIAGMIGATDILEQDPDLTPKEKTNVTWSTLNDDEPAIPLQISTTPNEGAPRLVAYMDFLEAESGILSLHTLAKQHTS